MVKCYREKKLNFHLKNTHARVYLTCAGSWRLFFRCFFFLLFLPRQQSQHWNRHQQEFAKFREVGVELRPPSPPQCVTLRSRSCVAFHFLLGKSINPSPSICCCRFTARFFFFPFSIFSTLWLWDFLRRRRNSESLTRQRGSRSPAN